VAAYGFSREWKFRIFMVLFALVSLELALQAAAWTGVLPGVNTKLKVPYARVYWTAEGRGNSIRNREGWYYPEFDLKASRRIAAIGDSMVEAVEVQPTWNHPYLMQQRLKASSPDWAVLGLGTHGTSPAFYIDVLEYAIKHFKPQEAIVYISMGSDVAESSPALNPSIGPYIYYQLDAQNRLALVPASAPIRSRFLQDLELSYQPFYVWLPTLLDSHCMTLQSALSVRDTLTRRQQKTARAVATGGRTMKDATVRRDFEELGFDPAPFALKQSDEVRRAMQVLESEIERCKEICDNHGVRLRLVTLPVFPSVFYATQKGRDWTVKIGDFDFFGPEHELAAFARGKNIQLFSLGDYLQSKKPDVEEIRSLYFSHGTGHFTEKGHRLCADAVYEAFYQTNH
jgi:hypothetical protein